MITTKSIKGTDKELSHTEIYNDNSYIGYVIINKSEFAQVGENWNYVPKNIDIQPMYSTTKKKLIDKIKLKLK